jgi:P2 family phage contractile tail tube protein
MSIRTNLLTEANVYLEDRSMLGQVKEIKLPEIGWKMVDQAALGLVGAIKLPAGIEALEGELAWNSFYPDIMIRAARFKRFLPLVIFGSLETYEQGGLVQESPVVTRLRVFFSKLPLGTMKQHEPVEAPSSFTCYYVRQEIAGQNVLEFDPLANIYRVGGEDQLSNFRRNLGML